MPDKLLRRILVWVLLGAGLLTGWCVYRPVEFDGDTPTLMPPATDTIAVVGPDSTIPPPLPEPETPDSLIALLSAPDSLLDRLATREYSYEERGLLVYGTAPGWYLVATADSARTWIPRHAADSLFPLESLLVSRLNYLTLAWDGVLRDAPSPTAATIGERDAFRAEGPDRDETAARVLQSRRTASGLWLEVEVLSSSGCDGEDPTVRATGWIPLWGRDRQPTAWFFSRGC